MIAAPAPGPHHPGAGARPVGPAVADLLLAAAALGASDLHLTEDAVPLTRIGGELVPLDAPAATADELADLAGALGGTAAERREVDGAVELDGLRFRVNLFRSSGRASAAVRLIPPRVPTMRELGLPPALGSWPSERQGLLLCCGPTGSGKSTTLAAVLRAITEERRCHVITLEDPVEHVHAPGAALVHQREVGRDSASFADALRAALREDPDVLLVGEMRDVETIRLALRAAETGHLVLSTVHASDAVGVVNRLIDVFPGDEQAQARAMLAATLRGVCCQALVRDRSAPLQRHLVAEVLVATASVRAAIREGRPSAISHAVETGREHGMQSFDRAFAAAVLAGRVSRAEAELLAPDRSRMLRTLRELAR